MMGALQGVIVLNKADNVAVALEEILPQVDVVITIRRRQKTIRAREHIPLGHKISLTNIWPGQAIIKYGETIGVATEHILPGAHVHIHNVESLRCRGDLRKEGSA